MHFFLEEVHFFSVAVPKTRDIYTLQEKVHFFLENFRFWNSLLNIPFQYPPQVQLGLEEDMSTACGHRMAHRIWKETKQQPSLLPGPAVPGCSLVSFCFLWAILCPQAVDLVIEGRRTNACHQSRTSALNFSQSQFCLPQKVEAEAVNVNVGGGSGDALFGELGGDHWQHVDDGQQLCHLKGSSSRSFKSFSLGFFGGFH